MNVVNNVTPILEAAKDAQALADYEVIMDSDNNTDELISEGFALIDIGVWVNKGNPRRPFCRGRQDERDAFFTFSIGSNPAPPVDEAPAHKNQRQKWGGERGFTANAISS